ncbi:ABC transporter permease [Alicyclobacillus cellulosilyticus]|uniref:Xylose transport system permease protein XylH n=1 Tax=Alicyclobacillus cellulosilyticus TaxID=1003997 RepID=A0A917K7R5_9BACL|nr:ABC transporter permease [Alicyclobacillus cellulosilyticus]GGJ04197.1 ABC transporter permease [Alicyclobacillus cellulosilyticus]
MSARVQTSSAGGVPGRGLAGWINRLIGGDFALLPVVLSLVLIWVIFEVLNTSFLTSRNLSNLVLQMVQYGLLAVGETLILLLGEIDLSIAAVSAIGGAVLALLAGQNVPAVFCIAAAVASGVVIGMFQGIWVTLLGVPAFIVTLAGSLGYLGLLFAMIGLAGTVPIMNNTIIALTANYLPRWAGWVLAAVVVGVYFWNAWRTRALRQRLGLSVPPMRSALGRLAAVAVAMVVIVLVLNSYQGIPVSGFILLIFVGGFAFITQHTRFGRHIYAVGGNAEAARRAGINVRGVKVAAFTLSSTLAAVGGIMGASRLGAASTAAGGSDLLMGSIAAAVIGGTSLFGGRGSVWNALAGALVMGSIENGMDLLNAPSSTKYLVEGAILLLAVTFDTFTRRRRQQLGK